MKSASGVIDLGAPGANMFGCQPCPKCKSEYRATFAGKDGGLSIECDDCGHKEPGTVKEGP